MWGAIFLNLFSTFEKAQHQLSALCNCRSQHIVL